ncbi:hypothetical protein Sjap_005074 [Stephania japonica]|uniref:Uncharacterized protein n=1 Tax=Stephania japonica TaxID=461633 RepID=A0AAP0K3A6_9MAGN
MCALPPPPRIPGRVADDVETTPQITGTSRDLKMWDDVSRGGGAGHPWLAMHLESAPLPTIAVAWGTAGVLHDRVDVALKSKPVALPPTEHRDQRLTGTTLHICWYLATLEWSITMKDVRWLYDLAEEFFRQPNALVTPPQCRIAST